MVSQHFGLAREGNYLLGTRISGIGGAGARVPGYRVLPGLAPGSQDIWILGDIWDGKELFV